MTPATPLPMDFWIIIRSRLPAWMQFIWIMPQDGISQVITCIDIGQNAIIANRLFGTTISSNYVEDFGDRKHSGTWYGILGTVQNGNGSTILGNKIFNDLGEPAGATHVYIGITQANSGTGHLSVTGNVIVGERKSDIGISVSGGQHKLDVTTSGNQVSTVGTVLVNGGNATLTRGS